MTAIEHAALRVERKTERLELRVTPAAKAMIKEAMSITGLSAGDLAYQGARSLLDDHRRMVLRGADRDAFLRALENPPEPTEALVKAARRYREIYG